MCLNITALLQANARMVLIVLLGSVGTYIIAGTALEARKPVWILVVFTIIKAFYTQFYVPALAAFDGEYDFLFAIDATIFPLLGYAAIYYFFRGGIVKTFLTFIVSELESVFLIMGSLGVTDWIAPGHSFMAIPVFATLFVILYMGIRPFLLKWRTYEIRNKWVPGFFLISYTLVSSRSYFIDIQNFTSVAVEYCLLLGSFILILTVVFCLLFRQNRRRVVCEQEYLRMQQRLTETHYAALRQDVSRDYERMLRTLDDQMEELARIEDDTVRLARAQSYLKELKTEYHSIRTNSYCEEPLVDAVLVSQAEHLKKQGILFSCACLSFSCGEMDQREFAQFLLQLLEMAGSELAGAASGNEKAVGGVKSAGYMAAIGQEASAGRMETSESKAITLHLAVIKTQLVLELSWSGAGKPARWQTPRWMKVFMKKQQGIWRMKNHAGGRELLIGLPVKAPHEK